MKRRINIIDLFVIIVMAALLFKTAVTGMDVFRYECYGSAFWYGSKAFDSPNHEHCSFILESQKPLQGSLYYLPQEYPILSLLPFSLGLTYAFMGYEESFKAWMVIAAMYTYLLLLFYKSRASAVVFALYLVAGNWATAAGRFDIIPALLTVTALICADKKHWRWAYTVLAIAVLVKLYPLVLFPLFFIAQQRQSTSPRFSWARFAAPSIFVGICAFTILVSFVLNREGTLEPLMYFQDRPFQIETIWASLLWLLQPLSNPLSINFQYGSINIISPLTTHLGMVSTSLSVIGVLSICWLLFRTKITLAIACTFMLMLLLVSGKVFSAQYLIWVTPFIAYVGGKNPRWFVPWMSICLLSTWIYPFMYPSISSVARDSLFFIVLTIRNSILTFFFVTLLSYYFFYPTHRQLTKLSDVARRSVSKTPHNT
jgi:hypothetical protein